MNREVPTVNGVELARRVIALRPETRITFISGHYDDLSKRYGALPPGAVFLRKPFALETLVQAVQTVLGARR